MLREGPQTFIKPSTNHESCIGCKFYSSKLVCSGPNPIHSHNCSHPQAPGIGNFMKIQSTFGNLFNGEITPNWCPFKSKPQERL